MMSLRAVLEAHAYSGTGVVLDSKDWLLHFASCECGTEFGRVQAPFDDAHAELRARWSAHLLEHLAVFVHRALLQEVPV